MSALHQRGQAHWQTAQQKGVLEMYRREQADYQGSKSQQAACLGMYAAVCGTSGVWSLSGLGTQQLTFSAPAPYISLSNAMINVFLPAPGGP